MEGMRRLPSLRSLHAFEAAARHRSFKAAAAKLGVSPTAVSHQIRLLEETCGHSLFRRRPRPLVLTGAGERLFPPVRNGFDTVARAVVACDASGYVPGNHWNRSPDGSARGRSRCGDTLCPPHANGPDRARTLPRPLLSGVQPGAALGRRTAHRPRGRWAWLSAHSFRLADQGPEAPTWRQWLATARSVDPGLDDCGRGCDLSFREELHAIDTVVAGQGIAICSDVVVSRELDCGALVKAHPPSLPGYGFYLVFLADHPRRPAIEAFAATETFCTLMVGATCAAVVVAVRAPKAV